MRSWRLDVAKQLLIAAGRLGAWSADPAAAHVKTDANEVFLFAKSLEQIETTVYEYKYPDQIARDIVPTGSFGFDPGVEVIVTYSYDTVGMAKLIHYYGTDDLPEPQLLGYRDTLTPYPFGAQYTVSIDDVRKSAFAGRPIEPLKAKETRGMIERRINKLIAEGDTEVGATGFVNNANVPLMTAVGGDVTGDWETATPQEIYDDLCAMADKVRLQSRGVHKANTIVLAPTSFAFANNAIMPNTSRTVLSAFLENNSDVRQVLQWEFLEDADAAGTGPRAVAYTKDPENLRAVEVQPFEQLAPQAKGLVMVTPCHAKCTPTQVLRPLSMVYIDGLGAP